MTGPGQDNGRADVENTVASSPRSGATVRSKTKGEVPTSILDRYLIERDRQGRPERFYRDHRATDPMFRDEGRRLVTAQAYPDTIADMMKIARHRGWTEIRVAGDEAFRREAWVQARTLGLDVKGYKPRERDRQASGDRPPPPLSRRERPTNPAMRPLEQRLKDAAVVVRRLISDPVVQARLIERAQAKVRGFSHTAREPDSRRTTRDR